MARIPKIFKNTPNIKGYKIFEVKIFAWIISSAGFLLAISVFFIYGVEEIPHPNGAIMFHLGGIAGALGIILFSLFPLLIIYQLNSASTVKKLKTIKKLNIPIPLASIS